MCEVWMVVTGCGGSSSSLFLFSSHIKQLTNTKNKFTHEGTNGDVNAINLKMIKERKACDWWYPTCYIVYTINGVRRWGWVGLWVSFEQVA